MTMDGEDLKVSVKSYFSKDETPGMIFEETPKNPEKYNTKESEWVLVKEDGKWKISKCERMY